MTTYEKQFWRKLVYAFTHKPLIRRILFDLVAILFIPTAFYLMLGDLVFKSSVMMTFLISVGLASGFACDMSQRVDW